MPVIVEFGGIKISLNFIQHEHNPPHIHCEYNGLHCSVNLNNLEVMVGEIPKKQLKKVKKMAETKPNDFITYVAKSRIQNFTANVKK